MCGDGSNDLSAIKYAHIGISILNTEYQPENESDLEDNKQSIFLLKFIDITFKSNIKEKQVYIILLL